MLDLCACSVAALVDDVFYGRQSGLRVPGTVLVHTRGVTWPEGQAKQTRCPGCDHPRHGERDYQKAGQTQIPSYAAGQVLSMPVNGRLTTPAEVEPVVVTNSVDGIEPERTLRSFRAKANDLDTLVFSAGSRSRRMRIAGRARHLALRARRQTQSMPASASHRLSSAREVAPTS